MRGVVLSDCKPELDNFVNETNTESNNKLNRVECSSSMRFSPSILMFMFYFSVTMMMATMISLLEMQFAFPGTIEKADWGMHMQSCHELSLSNLTSKLTAWNVSVLTTGSWWIRWCMASSYLVSQQKIVTKSIEYWYHLQNWPLQILVKLLWKWWYPFWMTLPLAWDAFANFHWSSRYCWLSNCPKTSRNRICREVLEQFKDY